MPFQLIKNQINQSNEENSASVDLQEQKNPAVHLKHKEIGSQKEEIGQSKNFHFQTNFEGYMEMYCDADRVAEYLDRHQDWFINCAKPMVAIPLGDNGYTLTIGRFGSFGYEVEAKINAVMRSIGKGQYIMHTVTIPNYQPPGYKVDYQAILKLTEIPTKSVLAKIDNKRSISQLSERITKVDWELNLAVAINFPQFIHKLPCSLIQNTGNRLLSQIVRQVSPLLTYKVQKDFHDSHNLPIPGKKSRICRKIAKSNLIQASLAS